MKNKFFLTALIISVLIAAATVLALRYWLAENVAAGRVSKIESGRIYLMTDVILADGDLQKLERIAIVTEKTRIEKYDSKKVYYQPVDRSAIKTGDSAVVRYRGRAEVNTFKADLIQLTSPADTMTVEELIKSLK